MFEEAERRIINLDSSMQTVNSRISACENEIYKINNHMYADGPIWAKIAEIECSVATLTDQLITTIANLNALSASLHEYVDAIRTDLGAKPEIPKQKIDLEISEQNGYIDLDNIKSEKGIWELYDDKWCNR